MDSFEKRGYLLENFRLFHIGTPQAPVVDFHYHEFCKVLLLGEGRGSYVVEGQRYSLRPGDVVLIGNRCVHRPELDPDTPYERIVIYIDPEFLHRESTGDCRLADCFSGQRGHVLRMKEPVRKKVFEMAAILEKELNKEAYGRDIASNAALLRLLVQIGREQMWDKTQFSLPEAPKNKRVTEIMAYLDAHLEADINIDDLAQTFYVSKYHMMRQFRQETGYTVYDYLCQRRLLRAKELIAAGMRATEACYRCGFRSYSSFTRSFSKHFGVTPTGRTDAAHRQEDGEE